MTININVLVLLSLLKNEFLLSKSKQNQDYLYKITLLYISEEKVERKGEGVESQLICPESSSSKSHIRAYHWLWIFSQ